MLTTPFIEPGCRKSDANPKRRGQVSGIPTIRQLELHLLHWNTFLEFTEPVEHELNLRQGGDLTSQADVLSFTVKSCFPYYNFI
jgi:hypothetical protein